MDITHKSYKLLITQNEIRELHHCSVVVCMASYVCGNSYQCISAEKKTLPR